MPKVKCPGCDRPIGLKESHFGRKLQCKCGQVFRAPDKPASTSQAVHTPAPASQPPIQFSCPSCMTMLQVDAELAGRVSACPCGAHVPVPSANDPLGLPAADPFGFPASNQMAALPSSIPPPQQMSPYSSPNAPSKKRRKKKKSQASHSNENSIFEGEILAGIAMMVGAVVWFVGGLAVGYIFFYPPILFFVGLASLIKGLID